MCAFVAVPLDNKTPLIDRLEVGPTWDIAMGGFPIFTAGVMEQTFVSGDLRLPDSQRASDHRR